jgi:Na+/phosphate symporter
VKLGHGFIRITPNRVSRFLASRFDEKLSESKQEETMAFDLVRASVNLVVASILIALGTSFKLPLSTTYVTFMVAMGTSLSDGAWGRESAVYRITGVLVVVGGWFITAFVAFCASFLLAGLIFFGKTPAILILILITLFVIFRTHLFHRRKFELERKAENEFLAESRAVLQSCEDEVNSSVIRVSKILFLAYSHFSNEKQKELKKLRKEARELTEEVQRIKERIPETLRKFAETEIESGHYYVQVIDHLKENTNALLHIIEPAYNHLDNNHPLDKEQTEILDLFNEKTGIFFNYVLNLLKNKNYDHMEEVIERRDEIIGMINSIIYNRIRILKKARKGVKISMTYIEMLTETKNLMLHVVKLLNASRSLQESVSPTEGHQANTYL